MYPHLKRHKPLVYDNNYFNDCYQGIPLGGYTKIIEKMLEGIEVRLEYDFFKERTGLENCAKKIVFIGMIDQFYDYQFGELEYRSFRFESEILDEENIILGGRLGLYKYYDMHQIIEGALECAEEELY